MIRWLIPLAMIAACSKSADAPPKPAPAPAAAPAPANAAPPAAAPTDAQLVAFCAQCYFKVMDCFKDAEFWQIFSTMYFANTNLAVDNVERDHWVGVMKEDMLKLYQEHGFEKNCEASLAHNKAPTAHDVTVVTEAGNKSCAAFASAFGYMVFNEGALHTPK